MQAQTILNKLNTASTTADQQAVGEEFVNYVVQQLKSGAITQAQLNASLPVLINSEGNSAASPAAIGQFVAGVITGIADLNASDQALVKPLVTTVNLNNSSVSPAIGQAIAQAVSMLLTSNNANVQALVGQILANQG